jgi:alpha-glucosidase (family GH31 glycosyl hydrolase)
MKQIAILMLAAGFLTISPAVQLTEITSNKNLDNKVSSSIKRIEVPFPSWVFGHVVWEDESTTSATYDLVAGYLERGIPVDVVVIDSPWETHYNTLEFDPRLYPDAETLIADLHTQGIRILLWITSMINTDDPGYNDCLERGYFVASMSRVEWWKGVGGLLDYSNPEAVEWWHRRLNKAIDLGIDGWKVDMVDIYVLKRGWKGWGMFLKKNRRAHSNYAKAYYSDFYNYTRERAGRKTVIMARPMEQILNEGNFGLPWWTNPLEFGPFISFASPEKSFMSWVGDQTPSFDGLRIAIRNILRSAREGYLLIGSDIGGYRSGERSKELFIRWTQLGAFCPIMENGGAGEHRPWMFDHETLVIYRFYALLHKALLPYLYSESVEAWRDGRSLITPLPEGRDQYLLGKDILIAPIEARSGKRRVVLPAGSDWWPLFPGITSDDAEDCRMQDSSLSLLAGGCSFAYAYELHEFPVFIRAGALIPLGKRSASKLFHGLSTVEREGGVLMAIPPPPGQRVRVARTVYQEGKLPTIYSGEMYRGSSRIKHSISSAKGTWPVVVLEATSPTTLSNKNIPFTVGELKR